MTHSRLSSLPLPNSLSSHPSIPHRFPCCLVLSESQSTAHPAHKLTPGNPSMTLRALTTEKRSQHQQRWKKNKREVKKTTTTKKTQGIGGALISYFTLSNCWLSVKGNPWLWEWDKNTNAQIWWPCYHFHRHHVQAGAWPGLCTLFV